MRASGQLKAIRAAPECRLLGNFKQPEPPLAAEPTPWKQNSNLSSGTMIPQMTVAADLTRSKDYLSLKSG